LRFDVVTIFPEMFPGPLGVGIVGRALERGLCELHTHDLRHWADPPHRQVDDEPYGGGAGMVFKPEPLTRAVESLNARIADAGGRSGPVVLLSPQGRRLDHALVRELGAYPQLTLICGRYEGVDERVRDGCVDIEISTGDYVVTGGELPAMMLIDALTRFIPEALGDPDSAQADSFVEGLLDHPHYTRPAEYRGRAVPEVLRSGNHGAIARWRRRGALLNTARKRPDLLAKVRLDAAEQRLVAEFLRELDAEDDSTADATLE
jgi:tRNA (guanine37-N1)-methyltransferase